MREALNEERIGNKGESLGSNYSVWLWNSSWEASMGESYSSPRKQRSRKSFSPYESS